MLKNRPLFEPFGLEDHLEYFCVYFLPFCGLVTACPSSANFHFPD